MSSSGKRYSCSSDRLRDENIEINADKNKAIIQKQNEQLAKLREHFVKLRNLYHDERRDYAMKSLSLQRAIESTKRKGDQLENRINEIRSSIENAENEKIANDLVEKIWSILSTFRKEIFAEAGEDAPNDSFMNDNRNSRHKDRSAAPSKKDVTYGTTAQAIKSKHHQQNLNFEPEYDPFDNDQPLSSPNDISPNMNNNDNYITPSVVGAEISPITPLQNIQTPISLSSATNSDDLAVTPTTTCMNEQFCDSIASRRTRRRCTTNVYYKEPSLRSALTPGDPFTFSLEDGIVTPTVPEDYSRNTPSVKRGRHKK